MGHTGAMTEKGKPQVIKEIFTDKDGNPVKTAKDAYQIEVEYRLPDGTIEHTILIK